MVTNFFKFFKILKTVDSPLLSPPHSTWYASRSAFTEPAMVHSNRVEEEMESVLDDSNCDTVAPAAASHAVAPPVIVPPAEEESCEEVVTSVVPFVFEGTYFFNLKFTFYF
jgi:hypothetical protein